MCSLGCYSGPGCSPPWDTEDKTDQWSPTLRLRHLHPHNPHYWTTLWLQRSRWVLPCEYCLFCSIFSTVCFGLLSDFLDILLHIKWSGWLRIFRTALCSSLWFVCCCCRCCCLSTDFVPYRLHGWWKWAFPGLMPSRPSELQTTTSTWQPTSFCNTEKERERELSEKNRWRRTEGGRARERKQEEKQPKQRSKRKNWEKMLDRIKEGERWRQTIFVQIIWRLLKLPEVLLGWPTWSEPHSRLTNEEVWSTTWETFASQLSDGRCCVKWASLLGADELDLSNSKGVHFLRI